MTNTASRTRPTKYFSEKIRKKFPFAVDTRQIVPIVSVCFSGMLPHEDIHEKKESSIFP